MKSRFSLIALAFGFLFLFFCGGIGLFAFGNQETDEARGPVNTEWALCITAADVSGLPAGRKIIGDAAARSLAEAFAKLDFRLRGEEESAYYRNNAWIKLRVDAAKALQTKRNERDLLIYKGEASWKYRKNLKTIDEAIAKLEEGLLKIDTFAPVVEGKPAFRLSNADRSGNYPKPPDSGNENKFCGDQKADAFIALSLSEYHGRIFLNLRMYTLYTQSYSYEDEVLFSAEELNGAMGEISGRLTSAVSGIAPSGIRVHASPPEAMVLVDNSLVGRGETGILPYSPRTVEVAVRADNHVPFSVPLELKPEELTDLSIALTPIGASGFEATVPASPGSKVFLGSLYVGEAPLTLQLSRSELFYVTVETPEGEIGSVVYKDNELVKGSAQFIRKTEDAGTSAAIKTKLPVPAEEKRVERARRGFYGAYGAFWVILPAALLAGGIARSYVESNNHVMSTGVLNGDPERRQKTYDAAVRARGVQIGANIFWGTALGVTFFQIFRYLYKSKEDATPIVKISPKEAEP